MAITREQQLVNPQFGSVSRLSNPSVGVSFSGSGVAASFGASLSSLGDQLAQIGETRMRIENAQAAEDKAYAAPLTRNPDGTLNRHATPPGGWENQLRYDQIYDQRYTDQLLIDITKTMDQIAADNYEDPDAADEKMTAAVAGFTQGIEDKYLGRIIPQIQSQQQQRVRAIRFRESAKIAALMEKERRESFILKGDELFGAYVFGDPSEIYAREEVAKAQYFELIADNEEAVTPGKSPDDMWEVFRSNLQTKASIYRSINKELEKGTLDSEDIKAIERTQLGLMGVDAGEGLAGWDANKLRAWLPDSEDRLDLSRRLGALAEKFRGAAATSDTELAIQRQIKLWQAGERGIGAGITQAQADKAFMRVMESQFGGVTGQPDALQSIFSQTGFISDEALKRFVENPLGKTAEQIEAGFKTYSALSSLMRSDGSMVDYTNNAELLSDQDRRFWESYKYYREAQLEPKEARQKVTEYLRAFAADERSDANRIMLEVRKHRGEYRGSTNDDVRDAGEYIFNLAVDNITGFKEMPPVIASDVQHRLHRAMAIELSMAEVVDLDQAEKRAITRINESYTQSDYVLGGWTLKAAEIPALPGPGSLLTDVGTPYQDWVVEYTDTILNMIHPDQRAAVQDKEIGDGLMLRPVGGNRYGLFHVIGVDANTPNANAMPLSDENGDYIVLDLNRAATVQKPVIDKWLVDRAQAKDLNEGQVPDDLPIDPNGGPPFTFIDPQGNVTQLPYDAPADEILKAANDTAKAWADNNGVIGGSLDMGAQNRSEIFRAMGARNNRKTLGGPTETPLPEFHLKPPRRKDIDHRMAPTPDEEYDFLGMLQNKGVEMPRRISQQEFVENTQGIVEEILAPEAEAVSYSDEDFINEFLIFSGKPTVSGPYEGNAVGLGEMGQAIVKVSSEFGYNPEYVAQVMSYETGGTMKIWQRGPKTKWGVHRGLIQMGEPQRAQYGYHMNMTPEEAVRASLQYLKDNGAPNTLEGMYTTIIGGNPNADLNRNDGYGSIRTHLGRLNEHKANAQKIIKLSADPGQFDGNVKLTLHGKPVKVADLRGTDPAVVNVALTAYAAIGEDTLDIENHYRDPVQNKKVGGAKNSKHLEGHALDLNTHGWSQARKVRLIRELSKAGAGGIGVYANNIHVDIGGRRAWGPSYRRTSVPAWAEAAIREHEGGKGRGVRVAQPFAMRQHNPAGLRPIPGTTGTKPLGQANGKLIYSNDLQGLKAFGQTLNKFMYSSQNTPQKLIDALYSDEEPYIRGTLTKLVAGVTRKEIDEDLDLLDPEVMTKVAKALITYENGGNPYKDGFVRLAMGEAIKPAPTEEQKREAIEKLKGRLPEPTKRSPYDWLRPDDPKSRQRRALPRSSWS